MKPGRKQVTLTATAHRVSWRCELTTENNNTFAVLYGSELYSIRTRKELALKVRGMTMARSSRTMHAVAHRRIHISLPTKV